MRSWIEFSLVEQPDDDGYVRLVATWDPNAGQKLFLKLNKGRILAILNACAEQVSNLQALSGPNHGGFNNNFTAALGFTTGTKPRGN